MSSLSSTLGRGRESPRRGTVDLLQDLKLLFLNAIDQLLPSIFIELETHLNDLLEQSRLNKCLERTEHEVRRLNAFSEASLCGERGEFSLMSVPA